VLPAAWGSTAFGRLKPPDVTRAALARLHHENAERPTIANYIVAVLSAIFTFGEARGHSRWHEPYSSPRKI